MEKIPRKDAERILNYVTKAKTILNKYDTDEYGGMIDCYCDKDLAQNILNQVSVYESLYQNSI